MKAGALLAGPFRARVRSKPIRSLLLKLIASATVIGLAFATGVSAGVTAERDELPNRLARRFDIEQRLTAGLHMLGYRAPDTQRAVWRAVDLNQHTIEWASIRVHEAGARGGALAVLGDNLVFSSPLGRFGYLGSDNVLRPLPLQAPTNGAAIRGTSLGHDPLFMATEFRVHDLRARPRGEGNWELYVSLSRFEREGCYQFKIVRTTLSQTSDGLHVSPSGWEEVFIARPGCIPDKDHGWRFQGTEAGGRMVLTGENTMLVSVGDHQFDGYNSSQRAAMDPNWDLGKIIQIDLRSLETRIYAMGMRNPQGLVVMRDGRIFSTEHGPQGGDEINFVSQGANYGWPGDAVDGGLQVLLVAGLIRAQDDKGQTIDPKDLERKVIGKTMFKVESATVSWPTCRSFWSVRRNWPTAPGATLRARHAPRPPRWKKSA
jgi:hypothetical protein